MKNLTLKELNKINSELPHYPNIRQLYSYDPIKQTWVFNGYKCCKCERVFKKQAVLGQHSEKCPKNRVEKSDIQGTVMTKDRKIWTPLEINQN